MKFLIVLLLIISCNKTSEESAKPVNETVQVVKFRWNNPSWDKYLLDEIGDFKIVDKEFCLKDKYDLARAMVEMAYWESKFDPSESYKESFGVYSRGLFQLSKVDGKRYGCNFTTEKSVHDPEANIRCAVKIVKKLYGQDKVFAGRKGKKWLGNARYWSVLRGARSYTKQALEAIKNANCNI